MSYDWIEVSVSQTIPGGSMASIEKWLLSRLFKMEARGDRLGFAACWSLNDLLEGELLPDDELSKALADSHEICPDLCSSVEREINASGVIMRGAVDYERVFQAIVRRNPDFLRHISINECDYHSRRFYGDERFTLITADAIESIRTECTYEAGKFKNVQIVRRSGPHEPAKAAAPYILFSKKPR